MSSVLWLVVGLCVLTYAADRFVLGAARLSTALRISPVIVGVVVIGFGTSAPELLVTSLASLEGAQDIAFGNIVGSNTANMLLVLGAAAVVAPVAASRLTLRRELPLMLAGIAALVVATVDGQATVGVGIGLLVAGLVVAVVLVRAAMADREESDELDREVRDFEHDGPPRIGPSVLMALLGLLGTLAGAQILVSSATALARDFGISEAVVGLTIVAVGTSLPEVITAVAAARRGEAELVVGNVLGSNLFNSLPIAGIAAILGGPELDPSFGVALVTMMLACGIAAVFLVTGRRLIRAEGVVLLTLFAGAVWVTST